MAGIWIARVSPAEGTFFSALGTNYSTKFGGNEMSKYIRRVGAPLALTIAFAVAACSKGGERADSTLAQDSALNRDLQLATDDSAAQPQLKDVPPPAAETPEPKATALVTRPRPSRPRPTTPAPTPEPKAPPR